MTQKSVVGLHPTSASTVEKRVGCSDCARSNKQNVLTYLKRVLVKMQSRQKPQEGNTNSMTYTLTIRNRLRPRFHAGTTVPPCIREVRRRSGLVRIRFRPKRR